MLPTQNRQHRSSIPATGLGSIVVAVPQLALVGDRAVVATSAVAVGLDGRTVPVLQSREEAAAPGPAENPAASGSAQTASTVQAEIEAAR